MRMHLNRSGAVEQLRVHVRNLSMLGVNGATGSKGRVELFERGYGKDAASIAREAISYGVYLINSLYICLKDYLQARTMTLTLF